MSGGPDEEEESGVQKKRKVVIHDPSSDTQTCELSQRTWTWTCKRVRDTSRRRGTCMRMRTCTRMRTKTSVSVRLTSQDHSPPDSYAVTHARRRISVICVKAVSTKQEKQMKLTKQWWKGLVGEHKRHATDSFSFDALEKAGHTSLAQHWSKTTCPIHPTETWWHRRRFTHRIIAWIEEVQNHRRPREEVLR